MAEELLPLNGGREGCVVVAELSLTVAAAATTATATTTKNFNGQIVRVEFDPGTVTENATVKGYEAHTALATGTRTHFIDYTVPASEVELSFVPLKAATTAGIAAVTYDGTRPIYVPIYVNGKLKVDVASATAGDSLTVRVYVRG